MKKKLAIVICLTLSLFIFVACGSSTDSGDEDTSIYEGEATLGVYLNNNIKIEVSSDDKDETIHVIIAPANGDEPYSGDLTQSAPGEPFQDENISITFSDDGNSLDLKSLSNVTTGFEGLYPMEYPAVK